MSRLLIDELPLQLLPSLAAKIGLQEAIVLQRLSELTAPPASDHPWVWLGMTYEQWAEQFPFWSQETIRKIIHRLRVRGLVLSRPRALNPFDRVNEYTVDHALLERELGRTP